MIKTKLECPSCGLTLATPTPLTGGSLVNCPRCGTCFGVPAVQTGAAAVLPVAMARPATAPPIARPIVSTGKPIPVRAPIAAPPISMPAPPAPAWFQEMVADSHSKSTTGKQEENKPERYTGKKGKRKNDNAPMIWSLVAAATLVMVAAGSALVMYALKTDDPKAKTANKPNRAEKQSNPKAPDKKAPDGATEVSEKKEKPVAKSTGRKDKTTAATNKKPDNDAKPHNDPQEPIPIPGLDDHPDKGKTDNEKLK